MFNRKQKKKHVTYERPKSKANKGVIIVSFIIIMQILLLITGFNPFSKNKSNNPKPPTQSMAQNIQQNMTSGNSYIKLDGVRSSSYGSYAREYPPLNVGLRPYYKIYTFINIEPHNVYQQFAVEPTLPETKIPLKIRIEMGKTQLPIITEEFNVNGKTQKDIKNSHGHLIMIDKMKFNGLYNTVNTKEHFIGKPYFIPPYNNQMTHANGRFVGNLFQTNGLTYNKISKSTVINIMKRSSNNNFKMMGY